MSGKIIFLSCTLFAFSFIRSEAQQAISGDDLGYTKGSFIVTDGGAAFYSVHLIVAPGVAGLQPGLSINYNSQGGNGPLGIGFSIGGFSVISRTGRTLAQDGGNAPMSNTVNFDLFDRYSLDGERLRLAFDNVPQNAPVDRSYGYPNTAYYTEQNNFSKIVLVDTLGGAPTYFKAFSKDGLISEYGNTPDSRIELASNGLPIQWLVNRISDRNGNYINFRYYENTSTGEYYPLKVEYSGNSVLNKLPYDSVVFIYEDRPDKSITYFKGAVQNNTRRIKEILSYSGSKIIRRYRFTYKTGESGNSLLVSLQEAGLNDKWLKPTDFQWPITARGYSSSILKNTIDPSLLKTNGDRVIEAGDFNGDGLTDLITYKPATGENSFFINKFPGDSFQKFDSRISESLIKSGSITLIDFNSDGRSDIAFLDTVTGKTNFFLADYKNGNLSFTRQSINPTDSSYFSFYLKGSSRVSAEDFTNDGLNDLLVYRRKNSKYVDLRTATLLVNNGNYNINEKIDYNNLSVGSLGFNMIPTPIDMGEPIIPPQFTSLPQLLKDSSELYVVDFDNNSFPDYFLYNRRTGRSAIYYNYTKSSYGVNGGFEIRSDEFAQNWDKPLLDVINPALLKGDDSTELHFVDLNTDGLPDLVVYDKNKKSANWFFNKGDFTFLQQAVSGFDLAGTIDFKGVKELSFLDANFDGRTDVCLSNPGNGDNITFLNEGSLSFLKFSGPVDQPKDLFISSRLQLPGHFMSKNLGDYFVIDPATGDNQLFSSTGSDQESIVYIYEAEGRTRQYMIWYSDLTDTFVYRRKAFYTTYPNTEIQNGFRVAAGTLMLEYPTGLPIADAYTYYQYEGAQMNLNGRGFRGFSKVKQFEGITGTVQEKTYYRDTSSYIFVGDPLVKLETFLDSNRAQNKKRVLLSESKYTLDYKYFPKNYFGLSFYSFTKENISNNYDVLGDLDNTTRTKQEVDDYGNVTLLVADYGNGYKDSTINEYQNDINKWILGRLTKGTVYRFAPNKPVQVRNSAFEYDPNTGQLTKEISFSELDDKQKITKTYTYDSWGNIIKSEIAAWSGTAFVTRATISEYDASGKYIIKYTNPMGQFTTNEYDANTGKLLSQTDPNGLKVEYTYDELGRPRKTTAPDGNWTFVDYKWYNVNISTAFTKNYTYAVLTQNSVAPGMTIDFYDGFDRKVGSEKPGFDGKKSVYEIEYKGGTDRVLRQSRWHFADEVPKYTEYQYDDIGRQTSETMPGNRTETISYSSNKKIFVNSAGQKKTVITNEKERIREVIDNANQSLLYDYDPSGNLLTITDPKGNTTTSEYDLRGNKVKMTDPDVGVFQYEYNGFNELIKQTDAAGDVISFEYDALGRLVRRTEKEGSTFWTYDTGNKGIGRLSNIKNYDNSAAAYMYDDFGRMIEEKKTISQKDYLVKYKYDNRSRLDTLIYPSGMKLKYVYNSNGFLSEVRRATDKFLFWKADKVNAMDLVEVQEQANNVFTEFAYNSETLFLDSTKGYNANSFFNRWQFKYNSLGNLTERANLGIGKKENFEYDGLNRLTKSTINGIAISVAYDGLGNITSKSDVGTYEYGGTNNRPHMVSKINLFNPKCIPSYEIKAEYTSFNKVSKIDNDTARLEIAYGFDRQRNMSNLYVRDTLRKTKIYVSDLFEISIEGSHTTETNYIRVGGGVIATYTVKDGAGKTNFWFKDHLGSLSAITDSLGKLVQEFSYDAWGKRRNSDWTDLPDSLLLTANPRGFTGHEHYDLFALVDMNGRIYDPVMGRFLSADALIADVTDLQSYNHYSYVNNNPLTLTDPSGYFSLKKFFSGVSSVLGKVVDIYKVPYEKGGKWVKENWKTLVIVAVVVATTVVTGGTAAGFWVTVLSGAAAGFAGNFTATLLYGGSFSDALKSGAKGAAIGAVTAGLTFGVGEMAASLGTVNGSVNAGGLAVKIAGHAIVQGGVEEVNGGKFMHGFYSGAISGAYGAYSPGLSDSKIARIAGSAAVGGTTSAISGGKFVNGAITGAYVQMFNEEADHLSKADLFNQKCDPDFPLCTSVEGKVGYGGFSYSTSGSFGGSIRDYDGGVVRFGVSGYDERSLTYSMGVSEGWMGGGVQVGAKTGIYGQIGPSAANVKINVTTNPAFSIERSMSKLEYYFQRWALSNGSFSGNQ